MTRWRSAPGEALALVRAFGAAAMAAVPVGSYVNDPSTTTRAASPRRPSPRRPFPSGLLGVARLPVLADALEDAGCADAELLGHLRGPGPHVRGCWAVDMIPGKS